MLHGVDADGVGENVLWKGRGTKTSGGRLAGDIGTFDCWNIKGLDIGCDWYCCWGGGIERDGENLCDSYTVVKPVGVGGKRLRGGVGDWWVGLYIGASDSWRALKVGVGDLCLGTAFGVGDINLTAFARNGDADARTQPLGGGCLLYWSDIFHFWFTNNWNYTIKTQLIQFVKW